MVYFEKFPSCYFFTSRLLFFPVLKSNEAKIEFLKYPEHINEMKNRMLYIQWSILFDLNCWIREKWGKINEFVEK